MSRIVLGTRGSDLARAQTSMVEAALRSAHPGLRVEWKIITTRGDERAAPVAEPLERGAGRKGLFTSEIERALLEKQIDVAVHSAKDLPSDASAGLEICAALPRAAVEDVLVAKEDRDAASLPIGATIATGSVRRQHQLRGWRSDVTIVDVRGNVPTRLRKLAANNWQGIILARAGLERLGFDCSGRELRFEENAFTVSVLPRNRFLPAGGQGIVALQVRADDTETKPLAASVSHPETLLCLRAEREFLRLLQGDCGTPVGVLATIQSGMMEMRAEVFDEHGGERRTGSLRKLLQEAEPEEIGAELLEQIHGR
ncbi:MAG: hydroxymethylbilane synthase [Chthoniobacterales bacterium]|nr:hydroxymethylbilane synthase [Chthoniobacterales bacterium]